VSNYTQERNSESKRTEYRQSEVFSFWLLTSLRSKRFRGVSEQKSLKNGIFEVLAARKMGREQKMILRSPHFSRGKLLSPHFLLGHNFEIPFFGLFLL